MLKVDYPFNFIYEFSMGYNDEELERIKEKSPVVLKEIEMIFSCFMHSSLDAKEIAAIEGRFRDGLTYEEIAEKNETSPQREMQRLWMCRRKFLYHRYCAMIRADGITAYCEEICKAAFETGRSQQAEKYEEVASSNPIRIEDIGLSRRAYTCLKRAGVNTIGDILKYDPYKLAKINNLGKKTYEEIIDVLASFGCDMKVYEGVLKNYTQIMSNQNYTKMGKSEYDERLKLKKEISEAKKEAEDVIKKQKEYMMSVDKLIQRRSKEIALELFEETFGDVPETYESRLKTFCENHICDNDGKSVYEHFTAYNKEMYERIIRDDEIQDFLEDQREFLKKATLEDQREFLKEVTGEKDAWIV